LIEQDRVVTARVAGEDESLDRAVRPKLLADYIGQPAMKAQMEVFIEAGGGRHRGTSQPRVVLLTPPPRHSTTC
jgi:holliday junction DNA helicase RuvB